MKLILLGPPGSGKGTQGEVVAERYGIVHLSTGDLLRRHIAEKTDLGKQVEEFVARGELVPDEVLFGVVGEAVLQAVAEEGGYLLDGFPRSLAQALMGYEFAAPHGITADAVLHLAVPDGEVVRRIAARAAEGRADDADEAIVARRLAIYHEQTDPLLAYYRGRGILHTIDAAQAPDAVSKEIFAALEDLG